ncbi:MULTISPECIES: hypothetical protein [Streptomyces]|uniref:hypothetical protein n=1 Tax=Streptomyces TaxID=1883 RepID=UPI0036B5BCF9
MSGLEPQSQPQTSLTWTTVVIYVSALLAGAALIMSGHSSPTEASGFVAPFLVIYERLQQR